MTNKQKLGVLLTVLVVVYAGWLAFFRVVKQAPISMKNTDEAIQSGPSNTGPVSPISGVSCDNWQGRPIAVMQPSDVPARPAAGFSSADMVFEMPVFTGSVTRLMGVYLCDVPNDIGSMRSARHDYLPLAKGLDAIFIHWGYSHFAQTLLLEKKIIDNIDCLTTSYCPRWPKTGIMRLEDTGHITKTNIDEAIAKYGYRTRGNFSGYPHQAEVLMESRPTGGHLRVAYPDPSDVSYDYDRATNSYLRTWDKSPDTDKNNGKRIAPKNIVVMTVESEQIKLSTDYAARGVQNPWDLVPQEDRAGINDIPGAPGFGRYNDMNIGDPWFDTKDSGDAAFYLNGEEIKGSWKKDKSKLDSKLTFYKFDGTELAFVPGQIYVEIVEPGIGVTWMPGA